MTQSSSKNKREELTSRLFPDGIPELWCPLLTHYKSDGQVDEERMAAHVKWLSKWVKTFLVPGSTGDGWEMTNDDINKLLKIILKIAKTYDIHIMIGILKTKNGEARESILNILSWLKHYTGTEDIAECLKNANVCGFTVCPPKGKDFSQKQIEEELVSILDIGVPTAIYQLPQITENEISPEVLLRLAKAYSNFYLFKDTSGRDAVAISGYDFEGVFLVRGAEGNYHRWLKINDGCYDGFLLSSANVFADELYTMITHIRKGRADIAEEISLRLSGAIAEVFKAVGDIKAGNPFANANKAIDHFRAYGRNAANLALPSLRMGLCIPENVILETYKILEKYNLLNEEGYLQISK